jgi:tryptophanase
MIHKVIIEPFRIKTVEKIKMTTEAQRKELIRNANYNPFLLKAEDVIIDLLTDSGTSAMSADQWAGILQGDESYAGARSWYRMKNAVQGLTGYEYIIPTHQGRAAEHLLYGRIGGKGKIFISNTHFDTTRANIEYSGAKAIDIPIPEGLIPEMYHPFKGNMDISKLEDMIIKHGKENIAAVILTITNNSGGGQPVSMQNVRDVSEICKKYEIFYVLDCCRIAENSYFVKEREEQCKNMSYKEIAQKMFSYADAAVMSAKKDALVNMGGFLALNDESLYNQLLTSLIITEGFATYGGLSGRDMEAIAIGLDEVFEHDYLQYRIRSTTYLGEKLIDMGISVISPIGGHAVYIDAKAFYPHIPVHQFPGQSLTIELYKLGGIRAVEIGSVMFGSKDEKGNFVPAKMELVRLAIPRRVYTQSHIDYVVEVFEELNKHRKEAKGYRITLEPEFLRHFTAHFEPVG